MGKERQKKGNIVKKKKNWKGKKEESIDYEGRKRAEEG